MRKMATGSAVRYLANAKSRLKLKGNKELINALETIENRAVTRGLEPDHITTLIDVAASGIQGETVNKRLLKALIPATVVPDAAVLKCVSWMCTRKPSINMQCLLVRWILVVYDFIDEMDKIHDLYGIFFYFLHYRSMMPYVCHLLYLLTRKEDIKLFRVRMLIQYQKDMGQKPFLTGLLSIYRHYYPGLVHVVLPRSYKSFFPTYDRKWIAQVRQVREKNGLPPEINMDWEKALAERLHPGGKTIDLVPSRKRRKIDPIPVIHSLVSKSSYRKDSLEHTLGLTRTPFVQIDTLKSILDHIDSIEFPSQIGAVLRSDTLRHLMSYTKDHTVAARFQFWLGETLEEELVLNYNKTDYKSRVSSLLTLLNSFSDFLQEGIPAVDVVLLEYLQTWNGVDFAPLILKLVSKCQLYSFNVLCGAVLKPLRRVFFTSSVYSKCQIMICLTEFLRNLAANEWPRHQEFSSQNSCLSLFCGVEEEVDGTYTLTQCIHFISRMILIASIKEKHHCLFEYCVLDYLELVSTLHQTYKVPFVVLSESRLFERLMISPNPVTVSRICAIMCRLKVNLISLKRQQRAGEIDLPSSYSAIMVSTCNLLVIEFGNSLWRAKAFTSENPKSIFNFNPREEDKQLQGMDLSDSLVIYKHPAFLGYHAGFLKTMDDDVDFHSDFQLFKASKRDFLQYLSDCGLSGLSEFVSTFIRSANSVSSISTTQVFGVSQASNTTNG